MQVLHSFSHWLRAHFGELDAVVFDIDGVLTVEGRPTPGASELLNMLSQFISDRERIITIEDAAELQLHQRHVVNSPGFDRSATAVRQVTRRACACINRYTKAEIERSPLFARRIIADLSRRLDHFLSDLESVTLRSGTERVVGYLLTNVEVCPRDGAAVTLPAAKGVIASRLSLTQEHFSRILHELAAAGLIGIDGRDIRIPDLERLRARAA